MKEKIKNRERKNISVVVNINESKKGLVFLVHGLGGYKEQKFLQESSKCLYSLGYTVVSYDSTNTFGESDGEYETATATQYLHDLEDVISWSKDKEWFQKFILVGHSLGGLIASVHASNNVEGLVLLNPAISKKRESDTRIGEVKNPHTGKIHFLKDGFVEDYLKYNPVGSINNLKVPFTVIVSDKDYKRNKEEFDLLQTELTIVENTGHNFREKEEEVGKLVCSWVEKNVIK